MNDLAIASLIFSITYLIIISERIHKTVAALAGGLAMIAFRVLDQEEAFAAIDLNVIFLLVGMMIIANTLGKTGAFQWLAIRAAKLAKGNPIRILLLMAVITAVASAFLDNVTTVVLMAPLSIFVASILQVNAVPFLLTLIMASNIGGTATLIGDPPNIIIGSGAELNFLDFLTNLAPVILLILAVFLVMVFFLFRRQLQTRPELEHRIMELDESEVLTDRGLLYKSLVILALVVIGFLLHGPLDYEPATVALAGATALILIGRQHPREALLEVDWPTIFFFVGLFMVVGGVEQAGLLEDIGERIADASGDSLSAATILTLWPGAILSGIVDNIPFTAAMVPVVGEVGQQLKVGGSGGNPLWWALALGAGLGGNFTIVAASANVYVIGVAERAGYKVTFIQFLRYGLLVTVVSLIIATVYVWLRYLI
ncbi:MAG: ArsB/NhaD family transporter [Dehalococcoidia bacterium]|nr:ArsB/NhaD family transporter [Dehalococcoidia bacterium]